MDLSVIIPVANEHPQILFTLQSLYCELEGLVDYEVVVVDNWCNDLIRQGRERDNTKEKIETLIKDRYTPWIKYVEYSEKLSHWNAKNAGIKASTGDTLLFVDGHCVPSQGTIRGMLDYYRRNQARLDGTLHLPLSYLLAGNNHSLVYKLDPSGLDHCYLSYSFTGYKLRSSPMQVPVMSSCGMMISRDLMENTLKLWPEQLGIYQGGEHYVCFTLAMLGKKMHVYPSAPLFHYAAPRGYEFNWTDLHVNRTLAMYLLFGREGAEKYMYKVGSDHGKDEAMEICESISHKVVSNKALQERREYIKENAVTTPEEYVSNWALRAPNLVKLDPYQENELRKKRIQK